MGGRGAAAGAEEDVADGLGAEEEEEDEEDGVEEEVVVAERL